MENRHQGYTNYETFLFYVVVVNDHDTKCRYDERVKEIYESYPSPTYETVLSDLADELEADLEENRPELEGIYEDLLNASLGKINYAEIAKDFVERLFENE